MITISKSYHKCYILKLGYIVYMYTMYPSFTVIKAFEHVYMYIGIRVYGNFINYEIPAKIPFLFSYIQLESIYLSWYFTSLFVVTSYIFLQREHLYRLDSSDKQLAR